MQRALQASKSSMAEVVVTPYHNLSSNYNGFGSYLYIEVLAKYKLDINWLSATLKVSLLYAKMIIGNKVKIDRAMAERLADHFCTEVDYWMRLQEGANQTKVM